MTRRSSPQSPGRGPDALIREGGRRYRAAIRRARRLPTPATIHAVRTTTRRLEALATVIAQPPDDPVIEKLQRELSVAFRASGRLRDLQIAETLVRARHLDERALDALLRDVSKAQRRALRRAHKALRRTRARRVCRRLQHLADREVHRTSVARDRAFDVALAAAQRRARRATLKTCRRTPVRSIRDLHALRLALKAERYLLELAVARGVDTARSRLQHLRKMQTRLGHMTDRAVLLRLVDRYLEDHPSRAARLASLRRRLEAEQTRALARWRTTDVGKGVDGREVDPRSNRRP
jgi:CHAD domain-containing protein